MDEKIIQDMTGNEFLDIIKKLPVTYLEPVVRKIVKEEIELVHKEFWVPAERHYQEHTHLEKCVVALPERELNHAFVSTMRKRGQIAFNISFSLAVVAVSGFVWAMFSEGFRSFMATIISGILSGGGGSE